MRTPDRSAACLQDETSETPDQLLAHITCSITARASTTGSDLSGRCAFLAGFTNTNSPVMSPTQSPYLAMRRRGGSGTCLTVNTCKCDDGQHVFRAGMCIRAITADICRDHLRRTVPDAPAESIYHSRYEHPVP